VKRLLVLGTAALALAATPTASAFHHGDLPATSCHAPAAGSPSNDNGQAKENLLAHNPAQTLPLPPVGTPAVPALDAAPAHETCANAIAD
jgi:hypothetical protein